MLVENKVVTLCVFNLITRGYRGLKEKFLTHEFSDGIINQIVWDKYYRFISIGFHQDIFVEAHSLHIFRAVLLLAIFNTEILGKEGVSALD